MTIREIVSRLRHDLSEHFADSHLFNRHLFNSFWIASRLMLKREADSNMLPKQTKSYRTYVIDSEMVNKYEGTCVPLECIACRYKLPKLLSGKHGIIYSYFGSVDQSAETLIVDPYSYQVKTQLPGVKTQFAFIEGDYIYTSGCLPCMKLIAIPDTYGDEAGTGACSIMDDDIQIPDHLYEPSFQMARQGLLTSLAKPYDTTPNKTTEA